MSEEDQSDPTRPIISQFCPEWIKVTEISHLEMVPGFISRRECLPDGSLDPNTSSVSTQMTLLQASTMSPSLSSVISNIPGVLMCESIHKKVMRDSKEVGEGGFVITHPPAHYSRTSEESFGSSVNTMAMASQTASELATLNILYGGVKGKAYLDSLKSFTEGINAEPGSKVDFLTRKKLESLESVCGFKVFNPSSDDVEMTDNNNNFMIHENHQICKLLNTPLDPAHRKELLEKLKNNLGELMKACPEEIKIEKFKGIIIQ